MFQLTPIEEFDIEESIVFPYLKYAKVTLLSKKNIAILILSKKPENILLVSAYGFKLSSVIAGLSEKSIEYIAKKASSDYKNEILSVIENTAEIKDLLLIAAEMDSDLGPNEKQNQDRINNVIQYIKDNKIAFEF